jgi:hypothetical protein
MATSQRTGDELVDRGRVFFFHFLSPLEWIWLGSLGRERKDLEGAAVKGQEVLFPESVSCQDEIIHTDPQKGGDCIIAVERQTTSVGDEHQEEVEQQFLVIEAVEETLSEETVLDEAEGAGDLTDPVGTKDDFFYHGL